MGLGSGRERRGKRKMNIHLDWSGGELILQHDTAGAVYKATASQQACGDRRNTEKQ